MKTVTSLALLLALPLSAHAQCDTVRIDQGGWSVLYVDSEELTGEGPDNGHAIHCIDGDSLTFWHTQWQGAQPGFPHEIQLDLGEVHAVNGVSLLSRSGSAAGKPKGYELYLSLDGTVWGPVQSAGELHYADPGAGSQRGNTWFGAVEARYLRLLMTSNYPPDNPYIMLAEFDVYEYVGEGCAATGQNNQVVSLTPIADQATTAPPITLSGTSTSGLPLSFSVVSGPATVEGATLTLDGTAGTVTVRAEQAGDAAWYAGSATTSFNVLDLDSYYPTVHTKLTAAYPVEMPALHAYAIHAQANIEEPSFNSIVGVEVEVEGTAIDADLVNGSWLAWWLPDAYGPHTVSVTAVASNGNTTTETLTVEVAQGSTDRVVGTLTDAVINFDGSGASQWYNGSYELPQWVGAYERIVANLRVSCPSVPGGCDDWDRMAWVQAKAPNGEWVEIIRYVTPYGKACNHSLDVTDFASLLQGHTELRMYIETWGTGGWQIDLDFVYEAGPPDHLYSTVQPVWLGNYPFGDPANLQPVEPVTITMPAGTEEASIRLVSTGHGWGANNTGNAAEFYEATHHLLVNGETTYEQHLWTTCNPNPDGCQPQAGTWQYSRAGWCPGSIAQPFIYDLGPFLDGGPFSLGYRFQEGYQDHCHPNNPNCVTGVTCADCSDGYNPFYQVSCYVISQSNIPLSTGIAGPGPAAVASAMRVSPNPGSSYFGLQLTTPMTAPRVTLFDLDGRIRGEWSFPDHHALNHHRFDVSHLARGAYLIRVLGSTGTMVQRVVLR